MRFSWHRFDELSPKALYALLQLRIDVFMLEQDCLYQELDNKDLHATHLLVYDKEVLMGYARVLFDEEKNALSFGRLVTDKSARGKGVGKAIMDNIMNYFKAHHPDTPITISAQCYLIEFYQRFGFKAKGEEYKEDGLPHICMVHNGCD